MIELHYNMGVHSALLSNHVLQQQLKVRFILLRIFFTSVS